MRSSRTLILTAGLLAAAAALSGAVQPAVAADAAWKSAPSSSAPLCTASQRRRTIAVYGRGTVRYIDQPRRRTWIAYGCAQTDPRNAAARAIQPVPDQPGLLRVDEFADY